MATLKHSWRVGAAQQGIRLDHFLFEALPKALGREVSRAQVRRLVLSGLVARNGRREQIATYELREGTRIEVFLDPAKFDVGGASGMRQAILRDFTWTPERILFEDEWLIVVESPPACPRSRRWMRRGRACSRHCRPFSTGEPARRPTWGSTTDSTATPRACCSSPRTRRPTPG